MPAGAQLWIRAPRTPLADGHRLPRSHRTTTGHDRHYAVLAEPRLRRLPRGHGQLAGQETTTPANRHHRRLARDARHRSRTSTPRPRSSPNGACRSRRVQAGFDMDFYLDWSWDRNGYYLLCRNTPDPLDGSGTTANFLRARRRQHPRIPRPVPAAVPRRPGTTATSA